MAKSDNIIFEARRIAADDWQVCAHPPGSQIEYITGFKSEAEAEEWIDRRSQAWAKGWARASCGALESNS